MILASITLEDPIAIVLTVPPKSLTDLTTGIVVDILAHVWLAYHLRACTLLLKMKLFLGAIWAPMS